MLGAIIGDIIGSPYEFGAEKTKDFPLLLPGCRPTDDSVMTIAVACACVEANCRDEYEFKNTLVEKMRELGRQYPDAGYGDLFYEWLMEDEAPPYGSSGNGSAMRVSPVAWVAQTLDEALRLARWSSEVSHNHPDGVCGAQTVAAAVYLAITGASKEEICEYIQDNFYDLDFTLDDIRPGYRHDMTCAGSVPQAIVCFLESEDYEDAVRNAISLGGDGDTQAAIAGAIAEAFYGIPDDLQEDALAYVDDTLRDYIDMCMWDLHDER